MGTMTKRKGLRATVARADLHFAGSVPVDVTTGAAEQR